MALKLQKQDQCGVDVEYWKIDFIAMDFSAATPKVHVRMDGYLNASARAAGKAPISAMKEHFEYPTDDFLGAVDVRQVAYGKISTSGAWSGAENV